MKSWNLDDKRAQELFESDVERSGVLAVTVGGTLELVYYLVVALEANSAPQQLAEFGTLSGTPAGALFLIMYLVRSYISLNTDIASVFAPSDQATRNRHIGRHFPNKEMVFRTSLYIYYFRSIVLIITLDNRA